MIDKASCKGMRRAVPGDTHCADCGGTSGTKAHRAARAAAAEAAATAGLPTHYGVINPVPACTRTQDDQGDQAAAIPAHVHPVFPGDQGDQGQPLAMPVGERFSVMIHRKVGAPAAEVEIVEDSLRSCGYETEVFQYGQDLNTTHTVEIWRWYDVDAAGARDMVRQYRGTDMTVTLYGPDRGSLVADYPPFAAAAAGTAPAEAAAAAPTAPAAPNGHRAVMAERGRDRVRVTLFPAGADKLAELICRHIDLEVVELDNGDPAGAQLLRDVVAAINGSADRTVPATPNLPAWAQELPVHSHRPSPAELYASPTRNDVEVREENVSGYLIRWAFDGPTGRFGGGTVYRGRRVGEYKTRDGALRAIAQRVDQATN
jgi:hypothetical protein